MRRSFSGGGRKQKKIAYRISELVGYLWFVFLPRTPKTNYNIDAFARRHLSLGVFFSPFLSLIICRKIRYVCLAYTKDSRGDTTVVFFDFE